MGVYLEGRALEIWNSMPKVGRGKGSRSELISKLLVENDVKLKNPGEAIPKVRIGKVIQ